MLSRFSHVRLLATLWTEAHQAPLSMGFFRQEYWRGLPCPPPGDENFYPKSVPGTSLVVQWLRICLPMQEIWVLYLVREDSTCREQLSSYATTTEARVPSSPYSTTREAATTRSPHPEPGGQPSLTATRENLHAVMKTQHSHK